MVLLIFGLPMFWWVREPEPKIKPRVDVGRVYRETVEGLRSLILENKNVTTLLFAFMLVSDALLTANLYFAVYLDQIFKMTDVQKGFFLVTMEAVAIVSAVVSGRLSDRWGNKGLLIMACLNLVFVYAAMSLVSSVPLAFGLAAFVGIGYGVFYTTARAMLVKISPPERIGEYFGFFATFQRFASIIGPMTWGVVTLLLKDYGLVRYRVAILVLAGLMFLGTMVMTRVKERRVLT